MMRNRSDWIRRARGRVVAGALVVVCLGLYSLLLAEADAPVKRKPVRPPPAITAAYVPSYSYEAGREVVLVFVGASFCGAHNLAGFPEAVEKVKVELSRRTAGEGAGFRVVGVALDWKPADGFAFLNRFGNFDQMALGDNWLNESALRYIWRDMPGRPAVPQLLVIERQVETGAAINVRDEKLLKRVAGADQIIAWAAKGAPL